MGFFIHSDFVSKYCTKPPGRINTMLVLALHSERGIFGKIFVESVNRFFPYKFGIFSKDSFESILGQIVRTIHLN